MIRRWVVEPDETGTVSREALIEGLVDAATMLDLAGGAVNVVTWRAQTGRPGVMVTTLAVVEWRDRTDAKPQPEVPTATLDPDPTPEELERQLEVEAPEMPEEVPAEAGA